MLITKREIGIWNRYGNNRENSASVQSKKIPASSHLYIKDQQMQGRNYDLENLSLS